jgi:hypothetical protein
VLYFYAWQDLEVSLNYLLEHDFSQGNIGNQLIKPIIFQFSIFVLISLIDIHTTIDLAPTIVALLYRYHFLTSLS